MRRELTLQAQLHGLQVEAEEPEEALKELKPEMKDAMARRFKEIQDKVKSAQPHN